MKDLSEVELARRTANLINAGQLSVAAGKVCRRFSSFEEAKPFLNHVSVIVRKEDSDALNELVEIILE